MQSSLMPRSRFPSSTSLAFVALAAACSDDGPTVDAMVCGPGDAPTVGLTATAPGATPPLTLTYGNLSGLAGNDCPDPNAPEGVVSRSIEGMQTDGTGLFTVCVPRPDLLTSGPRSVGTITSMADVRFVDLTGSSGGCTYRLMSSMPPTGTATASGVCANGSDPAGFALTLDVTATLQRTCGAMMDTVTATLRGTVAVGSRD